MLFSHLKLSIRSLFKNKSYTLLNLLGLSSGFVVFILITLYTAHEFSYDRYHEKADRLYRVYKADTDNFYQGSNFYAVVHTPLPPAMKAEFPEVEEMTRIGNYQNNVVRAADELFLESRIYSADPTVFDLFTLNLIAGSREQVLQGPDAAVISESVAMKYFGKTDVVGEVIKVRDRWPYKVTGVMADMPQNSHFVMDIILNYEGAVLNFRGNNELLTMWNSSSHYAFVLLSEGADAEKLQAKLPILREKYADEPADEVQQSVYYLQALKDMHFTQGVNFDIAPSANAQNLYIYMGIAFMILVIAGINYVNLATARVVNKTREVGIRKVIGAQRGNLIAQLMTESGLLVTVALMMAIGVLALVIPPFAVFIDKPLALPFGQLDFWLLVVGLAAGMTFLAGIYPALMLARFKPIAAMKGRYRSGKGNQLFRNVLVVFQFAVSCALILGATVLTRQLNYIQSMDPGFVRDQIVVLSMRDPGVRRQLDVFKDELKKIPGVVGVSSSNSLPNNISSNGEARWIGKREEERVVLYTNTADYDFVDLFGLEIVAGRNFDPTVPTDETAVLLNESAVKALGWEDPIGMQMIRWWGDTGKVIGVVKDFHQHSLHLGIEPIQIFQRTGQWNLSVKIAGSQVDRTIAALEDKYQSFEPVYPFEYQFFDDIFDRAYLTEIKTAKLANWFTGLAVLIACLGLYGLAAHKVQHRIKEVGVRKVLGASVFRILTLLSKDFALLLLVAFSIAAPVAYFVMDGWLDDFAFHIEINLLTFLLALVLMVLVAGLTVGYRTFKAAVRNPVEALRDE